MAHDRRQHKPHAVNGRLLDLICHSHVVVNTTSEAAWDNISACDYYIAKIVYEFFYLLICTMIK